MEGREKQGGQRKRGRARKQQRCLISAAQYVGPHLNDWGLDASGGFFAHMVGSWAEMIQGWVQLGLDQSPKVWYLHVA